MKTPNGKDFAKYLADIFIKMLKEYDKQRIFLGEEVTDAEGFSHYMGGWVGGMTFDSDISGEDILNAESIIVADSYVKDKGVDGTAKKILINKQI